MLNELLQRNDPDAWVSEHGKEVVECERDDQEDTDACRYLAAVWTLRAIRWRRRQGRRFDFVQCLRDDDIMSVIGLPEEACECSTAGELHQVFLKRLADLESSPPPYKGALFENIDRLSTMLELPDPESAVLLFVALLSIDDSFAEALDLLGDLNRRELYTALSKMLMIPSIQIQQALEPGSALVDAGLVQVDPRTNYSIRRKIELLTGLGDHLNVAARELDQLFSQYFRVAPPSHLAKADFGHIQPDTSIVESILAHATRSGRSGTNILIYGLPGVGKTEYVRYLRRTLDLSVHEVSIQDADGDPHSRSGRLQAYLLAEYVLKHKENCLLLFDEAEDAFPEPVPSFFGRQKSPGESKGWMNRLLEGNPVPCVWLTNNVSNIDDAYLRRFDFVFEMKTPPRHQRAKLVARYLTGLPVRSEWVERMSAVGHIPPAHIERAARVAGLAGAADAARVESVFETTLENTLRAMDGQWSMPSEKRYDTRFEYGYVNTEADLGSIVAGLERTRAGRICLYGPPGTGKSLFARHLARALGLPLVERRASDVISMYVGGTERNLAEMFREARDEEAVLLLDEADSFLQDRLSASRSWEITQVNELLTQMESFDGIFACTTNLFGSLDPASLRRFDLKIALDYLTGDQAYRLFTATAQSLGLNEPGNDEQARFRHRLDALKNLTPGDFAVVVRKSRVIGPLADADSLINILAFECRAKPGAMRGPLGFTS